MKNKFALILTLLLIIASISYAYVVGEPTGERLSSLLTSDEIDQLGNIGTTTISAAQWGYIGAMTGQPLEAETRLQTLGTTEIDQLENIDTTTISAAQWGYLGAMASQPLEASDLSSIAYIGDYSDNLSTAVSSIGATPTTLIIDAALTVSSNVTVPSTLSLVFVRGGTIADDASNADLTINGPVTADLVQIFDWGNGSGTLSFGLIKEIHAEWFGNTVAGMTQAIAATPLTGTLHTHSAYSFASTITINRNIGFWMHDGSTISFTGTGTAIDFTASMNAVSIRLDVSQSTDDWTSGQVGVQFKDVIDCIIYIRQSSGFKIGVYFYSTSGTIYFNEVHLDKLWRNQYAVYLRANGGNINGNVFYGGRISVAETVNGTDDRYGLFFNTAGTNKFFGPGIEIEPGDSGGTAYAVYFTTAAKWNRIIEPYIEGEDYVLGYDGTARNNYVIGHFSDTVGGKISTKIYADSGASFPGTNRVIWTTYQKPDNLNEIFPFTDVFDRALVNDISGGTREIIVPGWSWCAESGGAFAVKSDAEIYKDYLLINGNNAIGRWVDTRVSKDFWLKVDIATSDSISVVIKAYDEDGAALSGGSPVKGISFDTDDVSAIASSANFGNSYILDPIKTDELNFEVDSTVYSIWIGVYAGSTSAGIKSVSLKSDEKPNSKAGYDLVSEGVYAEPGDDLYALVAPVGGVRNKGERIYDFDPSSGSPQGWVIISRITTAANGGEPATETDVAVDSIAGISSGDIMGVVITADADSSEKWWWTSVNGAPAGGVVVMSHGVPANYTIADGAKVITYISQPMPNIT